MALLEAELAGGEVIGGETAFKLHDTHGFPIELTREIAAGRGAERRRRGIRPLPCSASASSPVRRAGEKPGGDHANLAEYSEIVEQFGPTTFTGYTMLGGPTCECWPCSSGDEKGHGGDIPRPHALLCRVGRTGRRYGHYFHLAPGAHCVTGTTRRAAGPAPPRRRRSSEGHISAGQEAEARRGRRAPSGHPAQPHRDPPAPLGAARGPGPRT